MTPTLLIDSIVRQTMVLVATLAAYGGRRAPLAHVADQVFRDLVLELRQQGIGNRVIADMFGIALRTYHQRVVRTSESRTDAGRSLWASVVAFIETQGSVARSEVLRHFERDDGGIVRGVLRDLVRSGMVVQEGKGDSSRYRIAKASEADDDPDLPSYMDALLLVAIHRAGQITKASLRAEVPTDDGVGMNAALRRLIASGAVAASGEGDSARYQCDSYLIPFGDETGWEGAVFDHYQALVTALVTKLQLGKRRAHATDEVGGSTYAFDLWEGHPMSEEVLGFLRRTRTAGSQLRERLARFNRDHDVPRNASPVRVTAYVGQTVTREEEENG